MNFAFSAHARLLAMKIGMPHPHEGASRASQEVSHSKLFEGADRVSGCSEFYRYLPEQNLSRAVVGRVRSQTTLQRLRSLSSWTF